MNISIMKERMRKSSAKASPSAPYYLFENEKIACRKKKKKGGKKFKKRSVVKNHDKVVVLTLSCKPPHSHL